MKLVKNIPQFLPVYGRRIRIYYKGINKLCTQCFGKHNRRSCTNQKVPWINYVRDYMFDNDEVKEQLYGKWWDVVDREFPGYFEKDNIQEPVEAAPATNQREKESGHPNTTQNSQDTRQTTRFASKRTSPLEQTELSELMARGLTLEEANSYIESKMEQQNLQKRMSSMEAILSSNNSSSTVNRTTEQPKRGNGRGTRTGPSGSPMGRGGLSFN